jgi:hypothetical protein
MSGAWRRFLPGFGLLGIVSLAVPSRVFGQNARADSVSAAQGAGGFNSLTDGQPGTPGSPQFGLSFATLTDSTFAFEPGFALTPRHALFRNSLMGIVGPTLDAGEGATDFEHSVTATWLQRWTWESGSRPTLATQFALQIPYDEPGAKVDVVATFVLARSLGAGVAYVNAWGETKKGMTIDGMEFGGLLGYKASVTPDISLVADLVLQTGSLLTLELAPVYDTPFGLSLGPGLSLGWSPGQSGASFNVGVQFEYSR